MNKKNSGFTLIECLVALLIIAIVLASSSRAIALFIDDVHDSYMREVASWVAQNQYNAFKIDKIYPNLGKTSNTVKMSGVDFIVTANVISTPNPFFRKVEISVTSKADPDHVIFRTVNFFSQY